MADRAQVLYLWLRAEFLINSRALPKVSIPLFYGT